VETISFTIRGDDVLVRVSAASGWQPYRDGFVALELLEEELNESLYQELNAAGAVSEDGTMIPMEVALALVVERSRNDPDDLALRDLAAAIAADISGRKAD
jgi:hypothetical protein